MLTEAEYAALTAAWQFPTDEGPPGSPTPAQAAKAGLLHRHARLKCGIILLNAEQTQLKVAAREQQMKLMELQAPALMLLHMHVRVATLMLQLPPQKEHLLVD
jgi:hypothetical protein